MTKKISPDCLYLNNGSARILALKYFPLYHSYFILFII